MIGWPALLFLPRQNIDPYTATAHHLEALKLVIAGREGHKALGRKASRFSVASAIYLKR